MSAEIFILNHHILALMLCPYFYVLPIALSPYRLFYLRENAADRTLEKWAIAFF